MTTLDRYQMVARSAHIAQDGTVDFQIPSWVSWQYGSSIFRFGKGSDFREEKRAFLESTFEMRAEMAARFRQRAARASLAELNVRACAIWRDPSKSEEERKRLLYMLWTDAAEPEDAELGQYGAQARAILERFIATNLPAGAPWGYSDAELVRLNASRGRAPHFDPYAPGAGLIDVGPPEPEHIDTPEDAAIYDPPQVVEEPSQSVIDRVAHALGLAPDERRARLFVAWDDAAARQAPADEAYVARWLPAQHYSPTELTRYAALRGDDAFTHAAH
jgi:hypothetical protein